MNAFIIVPIPTAFVSIITLIICIKLIVTDINKEPKTTISAFLLINFFLVIRINSCSSILRKNIDIKDK